MEKQGGVGRRSRREKKERKTVGKAGWRCRREKH